METTSKEEVAKSSTSVPSTTTSRGTIVQLGTYWDEWTRCVGSRYQRDQLYRLGRIDDCSKQWKDFRIAFRAKVMEYSNPKGAEELIATTYYKKRTTISPTAGAIWELKEKPGWN